MKNNETFTELILYAYYYYCHHHCAKRQTKTDMVNGENTHKKRKEKKKNENETTKFRLKSPRNIYRKIYVLVKRQRLRYEDRCNTCMQSTRLSDWFDAFRLTTVRMECLYKINMLLSFLNIFCLFSAWNVCSLQLHVDKATITSKTLHAPSSGLGFAFVFFLFSNRQSARIHKMNHSIACNRYGVCVCVCCATVRGTCENRKYMPSFLLLSVLPSFICNSYSI